MERNNFNLIKDIKDLTQICIVEVKVFFQDFMGSEIMVLGCNLMDTEPQLDNLKRFVDDLEDKGDCNILKVKYKTRDFTKDDCPKKYGATIH